MGRTPYEWWFIMKPDVTNLHKFGEAAVVLFEDNQRTKWDDKGSIMHFVGYT